MHAERLKRLKELFKESALQMFLITDCKDIFYYTGVELARDKSAFLVVDESGKPKLLVSPLLNELEGLKSVEVVFLEKAENVVDHLSGFVGFDEKSLTAGIYLDLGKKARLSPASHLIKKPREIKDLYEIRHIRKAARLNTGFFQDLNLTGKREEDAAKEIEMRMMEAGMGKSFDIIVASGENSYYIHYKPKDAVIKNKQLVIADFGIRMNNYCTDMTRTFCIKPGDREKQIIEDVKNMQQEIINMIYPGVNFKELQSAYQKLMDKRKYRVMHSVGHGIGLDVHEKPQIGDVLKENMVITIEPGVYIKGFGGCRFEDMVLVKKGKSKVLS